MEKMEKIEKMDKKQKGISIVGLVTAIVGLFLVIFPNASNQILVYGIGIGLLVFGAYRCFKYAKSRPVPGMESYDLAVGISCVLAGVVFLINSAIFLDLLHFILGLFLAFVGAICTQTAVDIKRFNGPRWIVHLIVGAAFIVLAVVAVQFPFKAQEVMARFIGVCMLAEGGFRIYGEYACRKLKEQFIASQTAMMAAAAAAGAKPAPAAAPGPASAASGPAPAAAPNPAPAAASNPTPAAAPKRTAAGKK